MNKIIEALQLASKKYDATTYAHAMRVAGYVAEQDAIFTGDLDTAVTLAILHDIIEDTDITMDAIKDCFPPLISKGLALLTKEKNESYDDYCKKIRMAATESVAGACAYRVKLADMKDHLSLKETLTDRLKEKYLAGLAELL